MYLTGCKFTLFSFTEQANKEIFLEKDFSLY